jgi:hypothetical protein
MQEKSDRFDLEERAMEKSEERLIAKLEEEDNKELNGETIKIAQVIQ